MKIIRKKYLPLVITGLVVLLLIFIGLRFPEEKIKEVISETGPYGVIVFILLTLLTYIFAPLSGSPLLFAGFYLYGRTVITYSFIAAIISSVSNFWISRVWGRSLVEKLAGKENLKKIDGLTNNYGPQTLFFFRIFLGQFHDAISYAYGLTKISFKSYLIISTLGMIPGTFIWYLISLKVNNPLWFTVLSLVMAYVCFVLYLFWQKNKK